MSAIKIKELKTEKDLQKLKHRHSDITTKNKIPTLEDRIVKLEREVKKLKKQLAMVNAQSQKAAAIAFNAEMRSLAALDRLSKGE